MPNHLDNKLLVRAALSRLAEAGAGALPDMLARSYHPAAQWRGSHPVNEVSGLADIAAQVWRPLMTAIPDLERRDVILLGGAYDGRDYVAAVGHYCGRMVAPLHGIPPTGRAVFLRYGEVHQIQDGRIIRTTALWDILDLIRQVGIWPVAPSLGAEVQWPAPFTADGVSLVPSDPALSAYSLAQTLRMQGLLGAHGDLDREGRSAMLIPSQTAEWHPRMMWYGPAGIGTARGMDGFVDDHRIPFRRAFHHAKGGQHYIRIGDGAYSATGGWPSVTAEHLGDGFLGLGATGRTVRMRVMDFYLHHEGLIRENWVPIDMLDLLAQMGCDVLARLKALRLG